MNNKQSILELSRKSQIPYATLHDLFSGKRDLKKCSMETGYKLSQALNISMEELLDKCCTNGFDYVDFDLFKSNVCHLVKSNGELRFISNILTQNTIELYWKKKEYEKAFYMLAMTDFLSKRNQIPIYAKYDYIREKKLAEPVFPSSAILDCKINHQKEDEIKRHYMENAEEEFLQYGIVEGDVFNVC